MIPRSLPRLRIAIACSADWNAMVGGERARFCGQCCQTVYNVERLRPREVADLLERHGDRVPCLRLFRRPDGTVVTRNCLSWVTAGLRRVRASALSIAALAVGFWSNVFVWRGLLHRAPPPTPAVSAVPVAVAPPPSPRPRRILQPPQVLGGIPPRLEEGERRRLRAFRRSGPVVTDAAVREAMQPLIAELQAQTKLPALARVSVLLDVTASGRIRRADLDAPADFPRELRKLVIRATTRTRLPPNSEDYQTSFTMLFQGHR